MSIAFDCSAVIGNAVLNFLVESIFISMFDQESLHLTDKKSQILPIVYKILTYLPENDAHLKNIGCRIS